MGNNTTFTDIIKNRINIPLIQRDYVQGLDIVKNNIIRKRLINDILKSLLETDSSPHDLGMVYGSKNGIEFLPFDGQQRLTTMWLFCIYIISMLLNEGKEVDDDFLSNLENNFNYQVRNTTIDFITILKKEFLRKYNDLFSCEGLKSEYFKNLHCYYEKFNSDPTVCSMLGMIDTIDSCIKDKQIDIEKLQLIYKNLFNEEHIYFNYVILDNYSMTDDIYIKLNARGLLLTDFENLKARIYGILKEYEEKHPMEKIISEKFSSICDIDWESDFYFNDAEVELRKIAKNIDERRINFIKAYFINIFFSRIDVLLSKEKIRPIVKNQFDVTNEEFSISIDHYFADNENDNSAIIYQCINEIIDVCEHKNMIKDFIYEIYKDGSEIYGSVYIKRLMLYSKCKFLSLYKKQIKVDKSIYLRFDKFIRNVLDNVVCNGAEEYVRFISSIDKLIIDSNGEINNLLNNKDFNYANEYSFNSTIKSNMISEIVKSKIKDVNKLDKVISKFGEHCAFVYEFLGIFTYNEFGCSFNEEYIKYDEKIELLNKYIILNKSYLCINPKELNEFRKKLIFSGFILPYPSKGKTFGKNEPVYDEDSVSFDCLLRSYRDKNPLWIMRNKLYDVINDKYNESSEILSKVVYNNYDIFADEFDKGFRVVLNRIIVYTENQTFSGNCYDLLIYLKSKKEGIDVDINKFLGGFSGWNSFPFTIKNDVYKVLDKVGDYTKNGENYRLLDESYKIK